VQKIETTVEGTTIASVSANRIIGGLANARCKCNDGYTVWNGACVAKCNDGEYRNSSGTCAACSGELGVISTVEGVTFTVNNATISGVIKSEPSMCTLNSSTLNP
jgi:hypothetical protein